VFTPISLYQMDRREAKDFIALAVAKYEWFLLFFDASLDNPAERCQRLALTPILGELSKGTVAVVDFATANDDFREYLYSTWAADAPDGVQPRSLRTLQSAHETIMPAEGRLALERLLYSALFRGDSFQPSLALANVRGGWLIRRKLTLEDSALGEDLLGLLQALSEGRWAGLDGPQVGREILGSEWDYPYEPRTGKRQSIEAAFADFLDGAEDVLSALRDNEVELAPPLEVFSALPVRMTPRFRRAFEACDECLQRSALKAVASLTRGNENVGLGLEKIIARGGIQFYRMRLDGAHRIHFNGPPSSPLLLSIGAHRLREYGYSFG